MRGHRISVIPERLDALIHDGSDRAEANLASIGALAWVATVESTAIDPVANLIQYGVLGIVVIGFIFGWIVPGPTAKQLISENTRLNDMIEAKLLPMIERSAAALERSAIVMDKATTAMDMQYREDRGRDGKR